MHRKVEYTFLLYATFLTCHFSKPKQPMSVTIDNKKSDKKSSATAESKHCFTDNLILLKSSISISSDVLVFSLTHL